MAEFKLGRIKFVWKGNWSPAQIYYVDDVIRYGGRTYICRIGHTSATNFYTDEDVVPSKWNQMSDGSEFKDDWTTGLFYKENDIVKYGALLYICTISHTSAATTLLGLETDQAKWTLYAEGFEWKNDWTTTTRYKKNDLVKYGGYTYIATVGHTSTATVAAGLEADIAYWDEFNQGIEYKSAWASAVRYKINDVVKYGAGLWIATTAHTSTGSFATDQGNWSQFLEGFEFEQQWNVSSIYQPGDIVQYGGNLYISRTNHVGQTPSTSGSNWSLFTEGFNWSSAWAIGSSYRIGDVVNVNGTTYLATADSPSSSVPITATNSGTNLFTGPTTSFVVGQTITFTGTTFGDVFTGATYYIRSVAGPSTFTVSTTPGGTTFTPDTASGTMTATVAAHPTNTAYWARLTSGISWQGTWSDDREYEQGDAVRYVNNTYICLLKHRSEEDDGSTVGAAGGGQSNTRPDLDITGTYWNILSVGSETSVLTTQGDLVYYGGAGPTRLPLGKEGQVLRAGIDDPEWATLGETDFKYYVGPHGTDGSSPTFGKTIDKPFKTIRYACEQVERGPRNPEARYLLELNRVFIQRETTEFIINQDVNNIAPYNTATVYDDFKYETKIGFLVDALIYDLSHGGNIKSRGIANDLLGGLNENEIDATYVLTGEYNENIAAYNYALSVIESVLEQTAPAVNYQNLNGDNSTAKVTQYTNTDLIHETGAYETSSALVKIITDAITIRAAAVTTVQIAAAIASVPARRSPNNLILIATGQYRETLPIIVPEQTCVQGDELRSTNAGPAGTITNLSDVKYSSGALSRFESVIGDVILGSNVTESAGNTAAQSIAFPYASVDEQAIIRQSVRVIQYQIDFGTSTTNMVFNTDPAGYNTSYLVGYGAARALIKENKEFIKAEIIAFINSTFSGVLYSRTQRKREFARAIDAILYDLTYGGATQSLNMGLEYFTDPGYTFDDTELVSISGAYARFKTVLQQVAANTTVTKSNGNTGTQFTDTTNLTGGAAASSFIGTNIDIITNLLVGDSTEATPPIVTVTSITGTDTFVTAGHTLEAGDLVVPIETQNGLTVGTRYYVMASGLTGTNFKVSTSYAGAAATGFTNGSGLTLVLTYQDRPIATDAVTTTTALIAAYTTLSAQAATIASAMNAYVAANYPTVTYDTAQWALDAREVLDAISYDFMFNSNNQIRNVAVNYLTQPQPNIYSLGHKVAKRAAFTFVKTQALANVGGNTTAQARITMLMTLLDDIIYSGSNEGDRCATDSRMRDYAVLQLERNRDYIVAEIDAYIYATYTTTVTNSTAATDVFTCSSTAWMQRNTAIRFTGTVFGGVSADTTYYIQNVVSATTFKIATTRDSNTAFDISVTVAGTMTVRLYYNSELCLRDVGTYIDAVKYDLKYPGNYKSRFAARYYNNAVTGSLEEDMYYLRDATGVRDMTVQGLTGDLLAPNEYGTSRVSAGAYASLDPGWGPDDYRTWIITRSPYVQGVTTIGFAAIGQKIDGALHNGGNDSITSNDFTQVISDGIGAWITNNGRAELVSVFSYYAHIGYLAENGGRIRGTNGNCSYGDFGAVAEGVDDTETPNTAVVDNRFQFESTVSEVLTDGSALQIFEFDNAGIDYTELTWTVTGGGINASVVQDDFRDDAVFEVRLLDFGDDSSGQFGGDGYITNSNTAQGGTTTQITIAATDSESSTAYPGMKIYLDGGTGNGQFGIINTYNSGSKIATVNKESTGTAGWDHVIAGAAIVSPDASTTYIIEPRLVFTAPSYASALGTGLPAAGNYTDVKFATAVQTYLAVATTSGSGVGATFSVIKKGTKYSVQLAAGGTGYTRLDVITIAGTSLTGASTINDVVITVTSINNLTGAVIAFDFEGYGQGGNFVALLSGTNTAATSIGGTWTNRTLPATSAWRSAASGQNLTSIPAASLVAGTAYKITSVGDTFFTVVGAKTNTVGVTFIATGSSSGTGTVVEVNSIMVAIATGTLATARSTNGGITWTAGGNLPATAGDWYSVDYGNGVWVAISNTDDKTAYSTNGGVTWIAGGVLPSATTWVSLAYGAGKFVAVASGGTAVAYSTDAGLVWIAGTGLSSSNWISVTHGNNRFVAVSNTSGTVAAFSLNGIAWTAATLPATASWTRVAYGQGVFLAVSSTTAAASSPDGIVWTTRTISTTDSSAVTFGNANRIGKFATISNSGASNVSLVTAGATARARAAVAENKIFQIRIIDPGSSYAVIPTMTITDPNNTFEAPFTVRTGSGVVANPTFINRGAQFVTGSAEENTGDGYADNFQTGGIVAVRRITQRPVPGSNVTFGHLPDRTFKLVNVLTFLGDNDGSYTAFFQVSPTLSEAEAAPDLTTVTTRIRYSQVRLTGHDFLDIGTGNFVETNYPGAPTQPPLPANEAVDAAGGRVFYTSTDQDGNFRVGELFAIEQSTGVATLNADAFNISGLQELNLGNVTLGGGSATITEFSTDPFFTADSDNVIPTQRAIKAYIASQIGGGGASLNVNSVTAGAIKIDSNQITNTTGAFIKMDATFDFRAGVIGVPLAMNYFLVT